MAGLGWLDLPTWVDVRERVGVGVGAAVEYTHHGRLVSSTHMTFSTSWLAEVGECGKGRKARYVSQVRFMSPHPPTHQPTLASFPRVCVVAVWPADRSLDTIA